MITAHDCVREMKDYLSGLLEADGLGDSAKVFTYDEKPKSYKGAYIAINALPFVYGLAVNDKCLLNINVHVPSMSDGTFYEKKMKPLEEWLLSKIPIEGAFEEDPELVLSKASYTIDSISQPRKEIDNTHYINHHIKIRFII